MTESLLNVGIIAQHVQSEEIEKTYIDSGDCEDSSSGSDRSFEADYTDGNCRGDARSGNSSCSRSKRKRRHGSHGSRRHKGGSRHKHKNVLYQPYPSEEINLKRKSQELQEKENAAAVIRRDNANQEYMTFPVAPFNSTQFLMDEHNASSPDIGVNKTPCTSVSHHRSPQNAVLHSVPSTPADAGQECINMERKDKEFSDIYTTVHAESLQSLPKEELVKYYISLEEKVAALQKKVKAQQSKPDDDAMTLKSCGDADGVYASVCCSDTNSLSSANEEFVDLTGMAQASVTFEECAVNKAENCAS